MANISILEQDLTVVNDTSTTSNVVYVPGYAIMGPANEPTLCTTLAEFKKIFGAVPYTFKQAQSLDNAVSGKKFITSGDYEKSYIYAAELLKAGLPVLFERVTTTNTKASLAFPLQINKLSGTTVSSKTYNFTCIKDDEGNVDTENSSLTHEAVENTDEGTITYNYKCDCSKVGLNLNLNDNFSLLVNASNAKNIVYDNNEVTFSVDTLITSDDEGNDTTIPPLDELTLEVAANYKLEYTLLDKGSSTVSRTKSGALDVKVEDIKAEVDIVNKTAKFTDDFGQIKDIRSLTLESDSINRSGLVTARYSGEYGKGISIHITKIDNDGEIYYNLNVHQVAGLAESSRDYVFSSNESNSKYYYENIDFEYIDLNLPYFNYDLIKYGLVTVADEVLNRDISLEYVNSDNSDEFTIPDFYAKLRVHTDANGKQQESILNKLTDRNAYQIKFITAGGYPTFGLGAANNELDEISKTMLKVAANRGDCIALIDHIDPENGDIEGLYNDLIKVTNNKSITADNNEDAKKYGAMFTPWAKYSLNILNGTSEFPGSYAYLRCLALSSKTNADWFAVAGATRGQVPDLLGLNSKISGALANILQPRRGISINPITDIKPYGYCIWGNRTLFNNIDDLTASSFLNIRMLTSDVKKVVYKAAKKLTFELNSDVLWLNFKAAIEPTLDQMVSGNGLRDYKIIKVATDQKATVACKIRLFAIESVEDWDITVELADGYTSVE